MATLFFAAIIYFRTEAPAWQKNARIHAKKYGNLSEREKKQKAASQLLQR